MRTVVETPVFAREADKLFDEAERRELIDFLAANPLAGDMIPGTGGVRKLRFAALGRGKRGGARVVHYFPGETGPVYALLVYAKARSTDLTPEQKAAIRKIVAGIKAEREKTK